MYVNERSGLDVLTDPYVGEFGSFGADGPHLSGGNPFEESGISEAQLLTSLTPCGITAILNPSGAADCVWNAIRSILLDQPNVEEILTGVATMGCSEALSALGLPSTVVALACSFGGSWWTAIQAKAQKQLVDLGFVPAGPPPGESICPPHVEVTAVDASGNPSVYYVEVATRVGPDGSCPPGVALVPGSAAPVMVPRPGEGKTLVAVARRATAERSLRTLPPGTITGRVVDQRGAPVLGAEIRVGSLRNNPVGTTDAGGTFSVPALATSTNWLYVSAAGYVDGKVDGAVLSGATRDVGTITLTGNVSKSGTRWYSNKWLWIGVGAVAVAGIGGVVVMRRRRQRG